MHQDIKKSAMAFICILAILFGGGCARFKRHNELRYHMDMITVFAQWEQNGELWPDAKARWERLFSGIQKGTTLTPEDQRGLFFYAENQRAKLHLQPYLKDLITVPEAWLKPETENK